MARVAKAEKEVSLEHQEVTWKFGDGQGLKISLRDLTPEMVVQCALHGIAQKGGDSYAGAESVADAFKYCKETLDSLRANKWSTRVAGAGGPRTTLLAEAIARMSGQSMESVIAKLETLDEATIKALRGNDQVKLVINTIKGERLKAATPAEGAVDVASIFTVTQ